MSQSAKEPVSVTSVRGTPGLRRLSVIGLLVVITIPVVLLARCGKSRDAARGELAQKGIPYSEDVFLEKVKRGDVETIKLFLAAGMNADVRDQKGDTALMDAIVASSDAVAEVLLKGGANVDARTKTGSTALHLISLTGNNLIGQLLLKNHAEVNGKTDAGETPLMIAALRGYPDTVKLLLNAGADVNAKDNRGETPLMHAVERNHADVIELLKAAGAKE